jgi:hypothetical protein
MLRGSSISHLNTAELLLGYVACFLNLSFDVLSVICRLYNLWSPLKIPFYLVPPIVFSFRAHAFFHLGTICRFSWNGTCVSHWRFHDNRHMHTSADVSKFKIVPVHVKCWILLKPVLGGVNGHCRVGLSLGILIFSIYLKENNDIHVYIIYLTVLFLYTWKEKNVHIKEQIA